MNPPGFALRPTSRERETYIVVLGSPFITHIHTWNCAFHAHLNEHTQNVLHNIFSLSKWSGGASAAATGYMQRQEAEIQSLVKHPRRSQRSADL